VPKEALISFVPFKNLAQRDDEPRDAFLRSVFLDSETLGVFRPLAYPSVTLTVDQYRNRISSFMMGIMDHVALDVDADLFVNTMVECFRDPSRWGYVLTPGREDLETMLRRVTNGEYAWGVSLWMDTPPELRCVCEKLFNYRIEAARAVIQAEEAAGEKSRSWDKETDDDESERPISGPVMTQT